MTANRVFGIDLGTTHSCIAYLDEFGRPVIIPNSEGDATTPSVVYFESEKNTVVGKMAKRSRKLYPGRVVEMAKRDIGTEAVYYIGDDEYKPEEISALILKKLAQDAATHLGEKVHEAVITCPAYFGTKEREATKFAGELAGLEVLDILNEPTAAAFYYGLAKKDAARSVLVYDLGGGTFDVTLLELTDDGVLARLTDGQRILGGLDWDQRIAAEFKSQYQEQFPDEDDPTDDPMAEQTLQELAEDAKLALSSTTSYLNTFQQAKVELTRDKLVEITRDLLDQTLTITRKVIELAAEKDLPAPELILLVGGMTRMPAVHEALEEAFGLPTKLHEPDQAVAKGATLYASRSSLRRGVEDLLREQGKLQDEEGIDQASKEAVAQAVEEYVERERPGLPSSEIEGLISKAVVNVNSQSFGMAVLQAPDASGHRERYVEHLIHRNTPLPATIQETFGTSRENQQQIHIQVYEQAGAEESPEVANNHLLIDGFIEDLPAGLPHGSDIEVTFTLNEEGLLEVVAVEPVNDVSLQLRKDVSHTLSDDERSRMLATAVELKVT